MGKIVAATWILGILAYYTIMFLALTASSNAQNDITQGISPDVFSNDPGFTQQSNPFGYIEGCRGVGHAMNMFRNIQCLDLKIVDGDNVTCNAIPDCEYSYINFGLSAACIGFVNLTKYGINDSNTMPQKYCEASGLQSYENCTVFKCSWYNNTAQFTEVQNMGSSYSTVSIFDTIGWVTTFNFDIGWGVKMNWLFSLLAFYFPMVILLVALYFILPFAH